MERMAIMKEWEKRRIATALTKVLANCSDVAELMRKLDQIAHHEEPQPEKGEEKKCLFCG